MDHTRLRQYFRGPSFAYLAVEVAGESIQWACSDQNRRSPRLLSADWTQRARPAKIPT